MRKNLGAWNVLKFAAAEVPRGKGIFTIPAFAKVMAGKPTIFSNSTQIL